MAPSPRPATPVPTLSSADSCRRSRPQRSAAALVNYAGMDAVPCSLQLGSRGEPSTLFSYYHEIRALAVALGHSEARAEEIARDPSVDIQDLRNSLTPTYIDEATHQGFQPLEGTAECPIIVEDSSEEEDDDVEPTVLKCAICLKKKIKEWRILNCQHVFCAGCRRKLEKNNDLKCPICRKPSKTTKPIFF